MDHEPQPERPDPFMTEHTTRDRHPPVGYQALELDPEKLPPFTCRCRQAGYRHMFSAAILLWAGMLAAVWSFQVDAPWSLALSGAAGLSFWFVPALIVDAMQVKLRAHEEARRAHDEAVAKIIHAHVMKEDQ